MNQQKKINVIGAGLAGCEAAWQAARMGIKVDLYEMKPAKKSPAHSSDGFAELVCSNSFRAASVTNAVGLLKEELRILGSLIMEAADTTSVDAGGALAVDRDAFSSYVTERIRSCENINVIPGEVTELPQNEITVVATGPLTSDAFAETLFGKLGLGTLHFFDAAAPIVDASSVNYDTAFFASRYGKGEASYLNCPMSKEEYDLFYNELINAKVADLKQFDKDEQKKNPKVFEGCMPVEVMASRGYETLLFGPMKPVGLIDPRTGKEPFACVQLRKENNAGTMFNIVGFQTHLTFGEQKRVFGLIPGLEKATFLRYGVMHRNTFIDSPRLLDSHYALKSDPDIYFAGQMTGVEGYIESCSSGFIAGLNAARRALGIEETVFPDITAIGALSHYVSDTSVVNFQPMNVNFGIIAPPEQRIKGGKAAKNQYLADRSLEKIRELAVKYDLVKGE
ncbi:MAG: methylenetetrahydrofolate--tRNA-(uracil(54)-C(5))-methyltransferase (FADH(2)-oxidizing) TrmFO [Clostridia bacterium]|nr:methylenetetrahydrofolate--tRNA-(uracil(54)-C(5))-methyltransferase (FADH(2)-oxidizing) TrmFO [Clostridia bacterium]